MSRDLERAERDLESALEQQALSAQHAGPVEARALSEAVAHTSARVDKLRAESVRRASHLPEPPPPPAAPKAAPAPSNELSIGVLMKGIRNDIPEDSDPAHAVMLELLKRFDDLKAARASDTAAAILATLQVAMAEISGLRKQVEALKSQSLHFEGVWQAGVYHANALVQRQGGLWLALRDTSDQPPSDDWRLLVKKGSLRE